MKAHIIKDNSKQNTPANKTIKLTGKGPYHGHPIRLTIGLIVKNEEKTLDRCLSSLQPLMQAVESELIITDTGSTDRTVEIAKKYTDHIIHFQWCNDFAAARNTGLKEARGEWFMFIDGDEWFEDTSELIEFFTSGECDKYGSASYIQRNYFDFTGKVYRDFHALRVHRVYPGIRFQGIVHETVPTLKPIKILKDYVHHYGYAFHTPQERKEKSNRNLTLLQQIIAKDPDNHRAYYQIAETYFATNEAEKAEKYCLQGLEAETRNPNRVARIVLTHHLVQAKFQRKKFDKVLEIVDEFIQREPKIEIAWLDFYYYAQASAFAIQSYERAASYGEAYLNVWEKYQSDQLDQEMLLYADFHHIAQKDMEQVLCVLGQTYLNLNDTEQAASVIDRLAALQPEDFSPLLKLVFQLCDTAKNWERLISVYKHFNSSKEKFHTRDIIKLIESMLSLHQVDTAAAVATLASIPWDEDAYIRLCRLRKAEQEGNRPAALKELQWFFQWHGEWDAVFSDVFYYAMKENVNLLPLVLKLESDDLKFYADNMQKQHSDFAEVVRKYSEAYSFENIRGIYWEISLKERLLLLKDSCFKTETEEISFFEEFAQQAAHYVRLIYRPELLSSDGIAVLPRAHRFGYYMGLAFSARNKANNADYLANLRLALKSYPVMKRQITLLLEQFEQEEGKRKERAEEFNILAKQAKAQIQNLIAQGKLKEAGQFTAQLAKLLPNDPDVVRFQTLTHTEPDMKEVAAHLPQ